MQMEPYMYNVSSGWSDNRGAPPDRRRTFLWCWLVTLLGLLGLFVRIMTYPAACMSISTFLPRSSFRSTGL